MQPHNFKSATWVPQELLLGPIWFFMFINDLPKYINGSYVIMFVHDTTMDISESNSQIFLQN